ncbi:uncharacterized protein LOC125047006 isoform X1 [Penaeus chinensis]|uniref:uncharacterized protein LOC125047006 isoform X1 n=2 Tax=Penaeus chinensis TaxID=139456 RepID=UPI001FB7BAC0|nr:uncharacterized protein LOC125047006 isoform X1 [Penaeus chinensis]
MAFYNLLILMLMGVLCAVAEELHCPGVGRFPDPKSCGAYYDCTPNDAGDYDKTKDDCRGFTYDTTTRTCTDKLCPARSKRGVTPDNHPFSRLCMNRPDGFLCANCKTMIVCVKGQAFTRRCIDNFFCSEMPQFGGGVCYPGEPVECTCVKANNFMVDLYDPQRFYSCRDVGSKPIAYKCPDGMVFDESDRECRFAHDLPSCTVPGSFAKPSNCSEYYTCIAVKYGWVQKPFTCSAGTAFNSVSGICQNPCDYQHVCLQEGRYADLFNKRNYSECYMLDGKLKQMRYQCPEKYRWEVLSPGVGRCIEDDGKDRSSSDVPFSECIIPNGIC